MKLPNTPCAVLLSGRSEVRIPSGVPTRRKRVIACAAFLSPADMEPPRFFSQIAPRSFRPARTRISDTPEATEHPAGIARRQDVGRHILGHHTACADYRTHTNTHAG